ncbi:hypothetical protein [Aminivibrio sp.]|uniref:hypothetical protein n=1 Tax=Aminivibrio sp. TaxID=1872489 RepID=UPI003D958A2F
MRADLQQALHAALRLGKTGGPWEKNWAENSKASGTVPERAERGDCAHQPRHERNTAATTAPLAVFGNDGTASFVRRSADRKNAPR